MILRLFEDGMIYRDVAETLRISSQAIEKRMKKSPEFAEAVRIARESGRESREFSLWLCHYRRGKRPPTGKGHGGVPRFSVKRRG